MGIASAVDIRQLGYAASQERADRLFLQYMAAFCFFSDFAINSCPFGVFTIDRFNGDKMEALAERLCQGDPAAFAELYDACADRLHHYLCLRLGSREDASDVLQETFVRLVRSQAQFAQVADPIGYSFVVARNEATRWIGRTARERSNRSTHAELLFREASSSDNEARETVEAITDGLASLDTELAEVIELKIYAGLTFAELAQVTGLPQGTVATRYRRAITKLREMWTRERL